MSNVFLFFFKGGNYAGFVKKNSKVIRDGRLKAVRFPVRCLPPPLVKMMNASEGGKQERKQAAHDSSTVAVSDIRHATVKFPPPLASIFSLFFLETKRILTILIRKLCAIKKL